MLCIKYAWAKVYFAITKSDIWNLYHIYFIKETSVLLNPIKQCAYLL